MINTLVNDKANVKHFLKKPGRTSFVHLFYFFRNGVSPASASIDPHGRFIENLSRSCSSKVLQVSSIPRAKNSFVHAFILETLYFKLVILTFSRYTCIYNLKYITYLDKVETTNLGRSEYYFLSSRDQIS
jgi:hypothetical protein